MPAIANSPMAPTASAPQALFAQFGEVGLQADSREAQRERFARSVNCGLEKTPTVARMATAS
jgi:hypothetical protein